MGNIKDLIKETVAIIAFCIGIYVLFSETRIYMSTLNTARQMVHDDVVYQQYNVADKERIPHTELISTLLQPLDYDIMVNGILIKKMEHTPERIDEYAISVRDYRKSCQYDKEGKVTFVIYTERTK